MTNNLRKAKKDLCAFAKKCQGFKYTDSALVTFLITGAVNISNNLFSAESNKSVESQKQVISASIKEMHNKVQRTRVENEKLLKKTNLELTQLMEQGDHVVKSPWSSWQYGMNYFYNDWTGTYRGRGDKTPNVKYKRNSEDKFGTYTGGKYGTTTLNKKVIEPISAVPVDAAVKPKNIDKQPPTFTVAGADGGFPNFETRTVPSISKIDISTPAAISTFTPPALGFVGSGFWQGNSIGTHFNGGGA